MSKKIVGIFVMMLLVATAVLPLVNSHNDTNKENNASVFTNESNSVSSIKNTNQGCPISVIQDLDGNGICEVDECIGRLWSYEGSISAAENYNYILDDADGYPINGPVPEKDHSKWFFYNGSDGLSLVIIHENATDGNGGDVKLFINVSIGPPDYVPPNPPNVVVTDDPGDDTANPPTPDELRLDDLGVHDFIGKWHFTSDHTDGGVIGNLSCYMMWIEVTPDIWDGVYYWQFCGYNKQDQEVWIPLNKNSKTCFLCGWKNCIEVNKTVLSSSDNKFHDEIYDYFPPGTKVTFNISLYLGCDPEVGGIAIPYSNIIVTDMLSFTVGTTPIGLAYDSSYPHYTNSPAPNVFEWDLGQIESGGYITYGGRYDILFNATIIDGDHYPLLNSVLVESSTPPGCCGPDSAKDSATMYNGSKKFSNLETEGSLSWGEIKPGSNVTDSFQVMNIGEEGSFLNWEITEYPEWGTWSFNPSSGRGLKPEDSPVEVKVEVNVPDEENTEFTGAVKIVNRDNSSDYCTIPVSLSTPENTWLNLPPLLQWLREYCPFLFQVLQELLRL